MSPALSPSERSPLLSRSSSSTVISPIAEVDPKTTVGPLDISPSTRYGILAGIWVATFVACLNTTLVTTLLPSISSEFQRSHQASWLGTAYLLANSTFNPLYGRLSNVLGRRGANQCAVFLCALGVLGCGMATNMEMLIAARFICGIGGGGIFTTASIITSDMYSLRSRGLAQGIMSIFNGLGMGLGGLIGGMINDWIGWRWAFLLQLPFFLIALLLTSWNLRYVTPGKGHSTLEVLRRIDYAGSLTLMGAVLSVLVFLANRFNAEHAWGSAAVVAPIVSAVLLAGTFVLVELRWAAEPVMAPFLLKHRISVLVSASNFLVSNCNFAIMYFFPMWFQTVMLSSASEAGLHVAPNSASMSLGSFFAGWMIHRTGKYRVLNLICGILPTLACILLIRMRPDSGPFQLWLSIIPAGFGNAVVLQTMLIAMLAHLPDSAMAVGTGFGILFRGLGQVGGVAISSAIFQARLDAELHNRIHDPNADEIIRTIRHSTTVVRTLPPDLQGPARAAYDGAIKSVFVYAACCTFAAFLVRLPIPEKDLDSRGGAKNGPDEEQRREGSEQRSQEETERARRDSS